MLLEYFTEFVLSLFVGVLDLLPFPDEVELGAVGDFFAVVGTFNNVLPITELMTVLSTSLSVLSAVFAYRVVKVLIAHIPGIGGSG